MVRQRSGGKPRTKARLCSAADSRPLPIRNVVIAKIVGDIRLNHLTIVY